MEYKHLIVSKRYKCGACDFSSNWKKELNRHIKIKHCKCESNLTRKQEKELKKIRKRIGKRGT